MRRSLALAALLSGVAPVALHAQDKPAPPPAQHPTQTRDDQNSGDDDDIVVTGSRKLPGSVVGDIPPEEQLGPAEVRSYGVSSVGDLLNELSPQTRSDRGSGGAPLVLLNGRPISNFSEIRDLPAEAIARVDILPEEVALKYGYAADQRVVNIVLRRRFKAITVEASDKNATEGGRNTPTGTLDVVSINRDNRFSLHTQYTQSSALFEDERDIKSLPTDFTPGGTIVTSGDATELDPTLTALVGQPVTSAGVPASAANGKPGLGDFVATANQTNPFDQGKYRTLLPFSRTYTTNAVFAHPIGKVNTTLNGSVTYTESEGAQGLPGVSLTLPAGNPYSPFANNVTLDRAATGFDPLSQRSSSLAWHLGGTANGELGKWRWNVVANYDRSTSENFTENGLDTAAAQARLNAGDPTFNPFGPITTDDYGILPVNRSFSTSNTGQASALLNGTLFKMPAGDVTTAIRVGGTLSSLDSNSFRLNASPPFSNNNTTRNTGFGRFNIDVPLTSKDKDVLGAIGNLSVNANFAAATISNFRTLTTVGYGANWSPIKPIRFIVSVTDQGDAPTAAQLGNPQVITPNVRVFDYVSGKTVSVTQTTMGNRALDADRKHTFKLGATIKPFDQRDLTITANYISSHVNNPIASFPAVTAAVEQAFMDRFTFDDDKNLIGINTSPVNFQRTERSELRWGFNFSQPIKSKIQKEIEAYRAGTGPNPLVGLRMPGGRRFGGGGDAGNGGGWRGRGGNDSSSSDNQGAGGSNGADASNTPGTGADAGTPQQPGAGGDGNGGRGGFGGRGGGFGGGRGGGRGGFGGRGGGFGGGGGRIQVAFYHTWHFTDRVMIAPGVPEIDLLNGGAIGSGGQSRHELEGQLGYSNNGIGVRFSADWQSHTQVQGGTAQTPTTLDFSSLGTINLRLFADLGQKLNFVKKNPWAQGMRVTIGITNILNSRQRVRDATGETPISYQPDYLDPLGRTIGLNVRKLFF